MSDSSPPKTRVALQAALRARLLPVAAFVALFVACSAPLAFLWQQQGRLQVQAEELSQRVARLIQREVRLRPRLWRYDTIKIVQHVRLLRRSQAILGIEIVDRAGRPISMASAQTVAMYRRTSAIWGRAPVLLHGQLVGTVWVAMKRRPLLRQSLWLLGIFLVLGGLLAAGILFIPMRSMAQAEGEMESLIQRLEGARASLARWNLDLEQQVASRSLALQDAFAALQEKEQRLRTLSAKSMSLQAEERRHIARELHDSAGQALTAIHIHLQLLSQQVPPDTPSAQLVADTLTMSEQTLEEIRRAVMMLGPAVLDDFGLATALQRSCEDFQERTQITVAYDQLASLDALSKGVENACYRIVQEAFTNVARHASATQVWLTVAQEHGDLTVTIRDNGSGFVLQDPMTCDASQSRGLRGIQERIELFGGGFQLASQPGQGTTLHVRLPLAQVDLETESKHDEP